MKKLLLSFTVVFIVGLAGANAQELLSVVTTKIDKVVDLSVLSGNKDVAFDFDDAEKLTNGIVKAAAFTLQTKANQPFYVTVQAAEANFSGGNGTDLLSVATLGVSIGENSTAYTQLTNSPQDIIGSSSSKITRGTHSYVVNYKMNPGFDAAPATDYSTTLTYTITAP